MRTMAALWLLVLVAVANGETAPAGKMTVGGTTSPDGKAEVVIDLPVSMRHQNRGGSNGAGLCVFASIDHAALYQNDTNTIGLFQSMFKEPGGGWPAKVDKMMAKYAPKAKYVQYEGKNPAVLELALKTGRMPAVTYGGDHMVSLVYLDDTWACCLDNNYIGANQLRWYPRAEFLDRVWTSGGNGWAVVLLRPRPPAPPRNSEGVQMVNKIGCLLYAAILAGGVIVEAPADASGAVAADGPPQGGVTRKVCPQCENCNCNGCACTFDEMMAAVGKGGEVPDDSAVNSLTFIGTAADTSAARAALEADAGTGPLMKRVLVQEFRPDNPLVHDSGFVTSGKPTIYAQRPNGVVIWRLDAFPGVQAMQTAMADAAGARKADPSYDQAKDPTAKPAVSPSVSPEPASNAGGGTLLLVLTHLASALAGAAGGLGGYWAIGSMIVSPLLNAIDARVSARIAAAAPMATVATAAKQS